MTSANPQAPPRAGEADATIRAVPIPPHLYAAAAARLVQVSHTEREKAARRFVSIAPEHGIDLTLMWGTPGTGGRAVHQVCLAVLGAGKTAMIFVSGRDGQAPDTERDVFERSAAVAAALSHLESLGGRVRIAQALLESHEREARKAMSSNGFLDVGELAYLRAPVGGVIRPAGAAWPAGVEVRSVSGIDQGDADRSLLCAALNASYERTLDCPELCGLRETDDVIDSHRATGEWRPELWRLVSVRGRPEGCVLLNHCPEQGAAELVYLGLSPALRGLGLGRRLLELSLADAARVGAGGVTCAVDRRNAPALRLYASTGFVEFGGRQALVRPLASRANGAGSNVAVANDGT